jgi:rhamnulokinase
LNTLFQLSVCAWQDDPQLDAARRLLLMPDLFHYWLTGEQVAEYTIASTTQMLLARERASGQRICWRGFDAAHRRSADHRGQPGTVVGPLLARCAEKTGLPAGAPVIAVGRA